LDRPFGGTILLAFILVVLCVGAVELLARTDFVRDRLPAPSLGTGHRQFDVQFAHLTHLVEEEGPVDCILLGNSMIWRGINPEILAEAYQKQTGSTLRCFNFGVTGLDLNTAVPLAQVLVQEFQPRLLILGITTPDIGETESHVLSSPWLRGRLGEASFDSWLVDHSQAYRYFLLAVNLNRPTSPVDDELEVYLDSALESRGYAYTDDTFEEIGRPIDPETETVYAVNKQKLKMEGDKRAEYYARLENFLQLEEQVQILVVEMPLHTTFVDYLNEGGGWYDRFVDELSGYLAERQVPFWLTTPLQLIPDDGWRDRHHVNYRGAQIFSRWLGARLAEAVEQGTLEDPTGQ
jgi:hypothetical protein